MSQRGRGPHGVSDYSASEGGKRRNGIDEKEQNSIGMEHTVYRYLCPLRKIGSIIGIGGDIAKQLRSETHAKIRISETIPGCDERVVTIYSTSDETNSYENGQVSPAQDALFRVHGKVVAEEQPVNGGTSEETLQITVRLLVPSDQIGCVIGKGGHIVQNIRNETHAQIRILGSDHLPPCALSSDELIQINGEATVVKNALCQVAFRLHDNPSRSQQSILTSPSIYRSGISFNNTNLGGAPASLMGPYRNHRKDREWSSVAREFSLRLVCPTENLGAVIGKGGSVVKQIRQDSGAFIVVDSANADGDNCIISVSAMEMLEAPSRTIDAIMRLQPRCSEKIERDSGDPVITTRFLVPSSRIGCIIGKGGAIIKEMRSSSRANIRIFSDESIPKVASEDDEMVQVSGELNAAKNAMLQVMQRLRANILESDGSSSAFPILAPPIEAFQGQAYVNRDNRMHNHVHSAYSGGYSSKTLPRTDNYGSYDDPQMVHGSGYEAYAAY
ncbi:KH domain-containing protein HEN4-like [Salvia splendens]|uniref:KH domain-containing protein HEN4-like n=1 Tax=Salvia splendens TaxID=180675 RepID=UPI001103D8AB|nr:KH domain-containing protein HEN4-like [Salvia splendens]XP_042052845.1 KH domain-containing protein HEN4-like [Salvia splendens]XP_042052846.1 KH domain-containing protein HEN4-like [Salvia splendens]XP_042052847.1 KH domain-containing protein HEN4-like [Salvia splendens]XP_042052848.1 KH domain-containing protein HEN4-like [Salvia splendens]